MPVQGLRVRKGNKHWPNGSLGLLNPFGQIISQFWIILAKFFHFSVQFGALAALGDEPTDSPPTGPGQTLPTDQRAGGGRCCAAGVHDGNRNDGTQRGGRGADGDGGTRRRRRRRSGDGTAADGGPEHVLFLPEVQEPRHPGVEEGGGTVLFRRTKTV